MQIWFYKLVIKRYSLNYKCTIDEKYKNKRLLESLKCLGPQVRLCHVIIMEIRMTNGTPAASSYRKRISKSPVETISFRVRALYQWNEIRRQNKQTELQSYLSPLLYVRIIQHRGQRRPRGSFRPRQISIGGRSQPSRIRNNMRIIIMDCRALVMTDRVYGTFK